MWIVGSQFISLSTIYHYLCRHQQLEPHSSLGTCSRCHFLWRVTADATWLCICVGHWVMADFSSHRNHQSTHCARAKRPGGSLDIFFQERYSDYKDGAVVRLCYIDSENSFILKKCVFILGRGCVIALSGQVCGEWHLSEIKVHATQRVFQSSTVAQSRLMVINMSDRNAKIYSMETSFLLTKWD